MTDDRDSSPGGSPAIAWPERIAHYRITARLGANGDRRMTSARDESRGRDVSILLVHIADADARKAAARRARLVAAIEHPNVAIVYEVGESGNDLFIVSEPLAREAEIDAAALVASARGAAAAHKRAMTHGALDRFSVWRAGDDETKVIGFGATIAEEDASADIRGWRSLANAMTPEDALTNVGAAALRVRDAIDTFTSMDAIVTALERANEVPSEHLPPPSSVPPRESPARRASPISARALALVSFVLASLAIVLELARRSPNAATTHSIDAAPPKAAASHGHSIDPRAEALFEAALQSRRDAAMPMARATLDDALRIDPAFAAAHLYRAIWWYGVDDEARGHLARANDLRADLDPRERALLAAFEPLLRATQDMKLALERLTQAASEHPDDADLPFYKGIAYWMAGDFPSGIASMIAVHDLDPSLAEAFRLEAYFRAYIGDERASEVYAKCIEISPASTHCLRGLSMVHRYAGRGEDAVRVARQMIALDPSSATANFELAEALECVHAPDDAVAEALEHDAALSPPKIRARRASELRAKHAILHGQFKDALRHLDAWEAAISTDGEEELHYAAVQKRVDLLLEMGRNEEARRALDAFVMRRPAWVPQAMLDNVTMPALDQAYLAGSLSRSAFDAKRRAWLASLTGKTNAWLDEDAIWVFAYGLAIKSDEDAADAIRVWDGKHKSHAFSPSLLKDPNSYDGILGIALMRAKLLEDAIAPLHHATASCGAIDEPFEHEWARMAEGEALEALRRKKEACAAYAEVITRWGRESSTAKWATARARQFCPERE